MHRSGTSALARGLQALGVSVGSHFEANEWNARGYFEHHDIVSLNDRLLSLVGKRWDSLALPPWAEWEPLTVPLRKQALAILKRDFGAAPLFGFKDPRASRIVPFWRSVFRQSEIADSYVIALRNPVSVARSLAARNGTSFEKSYLLWLLHMLAAVRDTAQTPRIVVDYDALLAGPEQQLARMATALRLPVTTDRETAVREFATGFLSASLRHGVDDAGALRDDPRAIEAVVRAYGLLQRVAGVAPLDAAQAEAAAEAWADIGRSLHDAAPVLRYIDARDVRIEQLTREPSAPSGVSVAHPAPSPAKAAPAPRRKGKAVPDARVSVVVPLYNHERYVEAALESVFDQTLQPAEIIVVDDGSTDGSADIVRRLCKRRREVVFWSWPNQGAPHTLNAAIHRATGEFVAILNSDDRYHRERLAECATVMRSQGATDVVATEVEWIDERSQRMACDWYEDALAFYRKSRDLPLSLCHGNFLVTTSNLFVRRTLFESSGYFAALRYTHDLEFFLRLVLERRHFHFLERSLLDYRLHAQNTIAESRAHHDVERAALLAFFIHRQGQSRTGRKQRDDALRRYVRVLGNQKLIELVEYFLAALIDSTKRDRAVTKQALPSQLAAFLSRLRIDAGAGNAADGLLPQFVAARNEFLRHSPDAYAHQVEVDRLIVVVRGKDEAISEQGAEIHRLYAALSEKESAVGAQAGEIQRVNHVLADKEDVIADQSAEIGRVHGVLAQKDDAITAQAAEIRRVHAALAAKEAAIGAQAGEIESARRLLADKDEALERQAAEIHRLSDEIAVKSAGVSAQAADIRRLYQALADKDQAVDAQASEIRRLEDAVADKGDAVTKQSAEIEHLYNALAQKDRALQTQEGEIRRLDEAVAAKSDALTGQAAEIHRLQLEKNEASLAHTGEIQRMNEALSAKDAAVAEQAAEIRRMYGVLADKEDALEAQAAEIRRLDATVAAKSEAVASQSAEIDRLQDAVAAINELSRAHAAEIERINGLLSARDEAAAAQAAELHLAYEMLAGKEQALQTQAAEIRRLNAVVTAKLETVAAQTSDIQRLQEALSNAEAAARSQADEIGRLKDGLAAGDTVAMAQAAEIRRLSDRVAEHERSLEARQAEIQRISALVASKDNVLHQQAETIRQSDARAGTQERMLSELNEQHRLLITRTEERERELASLRNTVWHKLGAALYDEKFSARKWARVLYYSGACLTPERLKPMLKPLALGLRGRQRERDATPLHAPPAIPRRDSAGSQPRPRVLHVIANFMLGGSSRLVMDLVEGMGDTYEQKVVTSYLPSPPAYAGADVTEFRSPQTPDDVRSFLLDYQPSLVHVHYWGECDHGWYDIFFRAIQSLGCRVIENVNTPVAPYEAEFVDRYVYVSKYVYEHFGNGCGRDLTIYPGSDFSLFSRNGAGHLPRDCIGMVYRLEADKLNEQSIDVFIKVAQRRPATKVLVVGGGTYFEPYRRAARAAGVGDNFEFTGYVDYAALPQLYERMTAFIAPVWKESFGQVGPFAMSMGIPVLGYAVGGITEIVDDSSLLAKPGDSDALADLVIELLDDPARCQRIGDRNRDRAGDLFSVEAMIRSYRALYSQVLETSPR